MRKAGGIIALVAGIFGVFAAGFTLFFGGVGAVLDADDAGTVIGLGWGGVSVSVLPIVLGAVAMGAKGRIPGVLLILCAIGGAVTFVAVFMALAAIGGILAVVGRRETVPAAPPS